MPVGTSGCTHCFEGSGGDVWRALPTAAVGNVAQGPGGRVGRGPPSVTGWWWAPFPGILPPVLFPLQQHKGGGGGVTP